MSAVLTPELLREADGLLDSEQQQVAASDLGEFFYREFGAPEGRISSQVRNLQQVAVSATRFADIEDFIKNQMGKKTGAYREWRQVGGETLRQLGELRKAVDNFAYDELQRLPLRLYLARGWVRAVVGAYLYAKARKEMEESHA